MRRLSSFGGWAHDPERERPSRALRLARVVVAALLVGGVVAVLVASNRNDPNGSCVATVGSSPTVPVGKAQPVVLHVDPLGRWEPLDFAGTRWYSGVPLPTVQPSSAIEATATRAKDHVDVVLVDGTKLYFAPPGCA